MPKRKRKISVEREIVMTANPFLSSIENDSNIPVHGNSSLLLQHVLSFSEYSSKPRSDGDSSDGELSLSLLLDFLEHGLAEETKESYRPYFGVISLDEVALLVLPWSIKRILSVYFASSSEKSSSESTLLVWRATSVALTCLTQSEDSAVQYAFSQQIMTQSTLYKLCPKLALWAISCGDKESPSSLDRPTGNPTERSYAASVFQLLTAQLFRPTLDVACKSLLIPIAEKLALAPTNEATIVQEPVVLGVLLAVMRLLLVLHLSGKGNAKTAFQLFSCRTTMWALSRVYVYFHFQAETTTADSPLTNKSQEGQDLVTQLLSDVLFHPRHHIDGFYSLLNRTEFPVFDSKKTSETSDEHQKQTQFRCYQEELLVTIHSLVATTSLGGREKAPVSPVEQDTLAGICIVPVLLRCFLDQTRAWDRQHPKEGKKTKMSEEALSMIQFKLFALWSIRLQHILSAGRVSPNHSASALRSLRELLELIHRHDTYTPSQDGTRANHFEFLKAIGIQVLTLQEPDPSLNVALLKDAIPIVGVLLQLNHLLLHNRATQALIFCVQDGSAALRPLIVDVLGRFFKSYRLLREQSFAFGTVLAVLDALCDQREAGRIELLEYLIREQSVASSIADAVQACPMLQAKEIFVTLGTWIHSSLTQKTVGASVNSFDVVSDLVVVATRNIRVDRATSQVVSETCHSFVETAVKPLAEAISDYEGDKRIGDMLQNLTLKLCAWVLELHGRCSFWLGRGVDLRLPQKAFRLLESAFQHGSAGQAAANYTDGLVLLGCHRLRQLHSEIHDQECREIEGESEERRSQSLVSEAKRIAAAISVTVNQLGGNPRICQKRGWSLVAESFMFWIRYAEDSHTWDFLKWMCAALALPVSPEERDLLRDNEIARALLVDASFFENKTIRSCLAHFALSSSLDSIIGCLRKCKDKRIQTVLSKLQSPTVAKPSLNAFQPLSKAHVVLKGIHLNSKTDLITESKNACQLVLAITGLPLVESSPFRPAETVVLGCKLDFVLRCLITTECAGTDDILSSINSIRRFFSKAASSTFRISVNPNTGDKQLSTFIGSFLAISSDLVTESFAQRDVGQFYFATGQLFQSFVEALLSSGRVLCLTGALRDLVESDWSKETQRLEALASFGRYAVDGIRTYCLAHAAEKSRVDAAINPLVEYLWSMVETAWKIGECDLLGAMLLASDLLRLGRRPTFANNLEERIETYCINTIESKKPDVRIFSACCSMLGSLVLLAPERASRNRIIGLALKSHESNPTIDAAFSTLVQYLPDEELKSIVERILTSVNSCVEHVSPVRLFLILFQYLQNDNQIQVLAEFGGRLLSCAFSHFNSASSTTDLDVALTVVDRLVNRRDILILREFDLAIVLSQLTTLLDGSNADSDFRIQSSTFALCCTLLASMQQRYTKLLYACVPCVVTVYSALLGLAMEGPEVEERARQFARVCELLVSHRDIYKKHVLGLILRFVRGLDEIDFKRRDCLIPAVYYLLDVMSTYEIQQLNASMDIQHRLLFRTIYQGYQKVHSYTGR